MSIDQGVQTAQGVGLLEPAIGPHRRVQILVAERQARRLIFAWVLLKDELCAQVAKGVGVEVGPCFLFNCALDLGRQLRGGLCAAFARRKKEAVGVGRQQRPTAIEIGIKQFIDAFRQKYASGTPFLTSSEGNTMCRGPPGRRWSKWRPS